MYWVIVASFHQVACPCSVLSMQWGGVLAPNQHHSVVVWTSDSNNDLPWPLIEVCVRVQNLTNLCGFTWLLLNQTLICMSNGWLMCSDLKWDDVPICSLSFSNLYFITYLSLEEWYFLCCEITCMGLFINDGTQLEVIQNWLFLLLWPKFMCTVRYRIVLGWCDVDMV